MTKWPIGLVGVEPWRLTVSHQERYAKNVYLKKHINVGTLNPELLRRGSADCLVMVLARFLLC